MANCKHKDSPHTCMLNGTPFCVLCLWKKTEKLKVRQMDVQEYNLEEIYWQDDESDKIIEASRFLDPSSLSRIEKVHFDKVMTAELSYPILLSHQHIILDGRHRLAKAILINKVNISCKIVPKEIFKECCFLD